MNGQIDEVKSKIDIVDFIGSYISLKKAGRNFKANCPFHQEKSPSFVVSPDRQLWHCFGACHEGGDIFKFLMKWDNLTFFEALKELAYKAGVSLESLSVQDEVWNKKERLLKINRTATEMFKYLLTENKAGKKAYDYVIQRQIHPNIIKKFEMGYAPDTWDLLLKYFKKKGYSEEELVDVGLVIKSAKGSYYDRFRNRLMFPIKDHRGNIIGFSGRSISADVREAKYINTPETPLYRKRETLYGLDLAKDAIKKSNNVYIVEGEFDMISPYQHGYENFVAIKGSALTREQLTLLKRYTTRLTLMLDADEAGIDAAKRGVDVAEDFEFDIHVINISEGKDPDEMIRKHPLEFKNLLQSSVPFYDFVIQKSNDKYNLKEAFGKKEFADEVLVYIGKIKNPIIKSHYVKKVADMLQVTESSVDAEIRKLGKLKKTTFVRRTATTSTDEPREISLQKYILSYLFQQNSSNSEWKEIFNVLTADDFSLPSYQKILAAFLQVPIEQYMPNSFVESLPKELQPVFNEVYMYTSIEDTINTKQVQKIACEIKKAALKKKIAEVMVANETADRDQLLSKYNKELTQVEKTLSAL